MMLCNPYFSGSVGLLKIAKACQIGIDISIIWCYSDFTRYEGSDFMNLTKSDLDAITIVVRTELSPVNNRLDRVEGRLDNLEGRFDNLEGRFDNLVLKVDTLDADVSSLKSGQKQIRRDINRLDDNIKRLDDNIKRLDDKVNATYDLALDAWGTGTENRTWIDEQEKAKA